MQCTMQLCNYEPMQLPSYMQLCLKKMRNSREALPPPRQRPPQALRAPQPLLPEAAAGAHFPPVAAGGPSESARCARPCQVEGVWSLEFGSRVEGVWSLGVWDFGVWECGSLGVWEVGVWEFGSLEFGSLGVWEFGSLGGGDWDNLTGVHRAASFAAAPWENKVPPKKRMKPVENEQMVHSPFVRFRA